MSRSLVIFCDDLLSSSQIREAAKALALPTEVARNQAQLSKKWLEVQPPLLLIVDLHHHEYMAEELMNSLPKDKDVRVVGFGAHVDTNRLASAEAAGFHAVYPRSKFFGQLESLLQAHSA